MTDPITDMLNQIKNAEAVGKTEILIPLSKIKNEIAGILFKEGFIGEIKKIFDKTPSQLNALLHILLALTLQYILLIPLYIVSYLSFTK